MHYIPSFVSNRQMRTNAFRDMKAAVEDYL